MQNVLVPTDFSECAAAALQAAEQWCEKFNAQLHLLHQEGKDTDPQAIGQINSMHPHAIFTQVRSEAPLWKVVEEYVGAHSIDLVIMGSHGRSGKNEFFIGSNAQRVVRMVACSVLVVKKPLGQLDFDKVMFASQFDVEDDLPVFRQFQKMVEPFLPEVHLLHVNTTLFAQRRRDVKSQMVVFEQAAAPLRVKSHWVKSFSVDGGIRFLAAELGVKLIGIGNHHRNPLRRMLIGSVVEALVNHSELPVLAVGQKMV